MRQKLLLNKDIVILQAIDEAISKIEEFISSFNDAESFFESKVHFDAVLMNFVFIGESVEKLQKDFRESHSDIPWQKIKDFRNLIAHDYLGVDAEEVWQIIGTHLKRFKEQITVIIEKES